MQLQTVDWLIIISFLVLSLIIGLLVTRKASKNASEFFLSGSNMPWWLLGVSMVATTFATDTPNIVTDIIRLNGVAGNWAWWAFLLTGMLTVFVYAKLWKRSGVMTDIEFYELRYSGNVAKFLRGFRAIYLGVFCNIIIMGNVTLAAIKIGGVLLGLSPFEVIALAALITVSYSMLGGLRGVLLTDFVQFGMAMVGSLWAANYILGLEQVGGLSGLLSHPNVSGKLDMIPSIDNKELFVTVFAIPLAVQWWSVYYPSSEPGGGGYIVQRMLAAKNEKHATAATLFFNFAHYALRPWPWILIALASLVIYPDLNSLAQAFPHINESIIRHDLAYSAMLSHLPSGLLGLVLASLIAAYMSTISTHLNWGSSYVVNDVYRRYIRKNASDKEFVFVGRLSTVVLMVGGCLLAPYLENAKRGFDLLLQIGAGTGLIFILRWFWWRINAMCEIVAMIVSFLVAFYFEILHHNIFDFDFSLASKLLIGIGITSVSWIVTIYITKPTDMKVLLSFYQKVHPGGIGWKRVIDYAHINNIELKTRQEKSTLPLGILCMVIGCISVYSALFATGCWIYGRTVPAILLTVLAVVTAGLIALAWNRLLDKEPQEEVSKENQAGVR